MDEFRTGRRGTDRASEKKQGRSQKGDRGNRDKCELARSRLAPDYYVIYHPILTVLIVAVCVSEGRTETETRWTYRRSSLTAHLYGQQTSA